MKTCHNCNDNAVFFINDERYVCDKDEGLALLIHEYCEVSEITGEI